MKYGVLHDRKMYFNIVDHLDGNPLPWVTEVKHLGNTLESDNSMKMDCAVKRGVFIGKVNYIL